MQHRMRKHKNIVVFIISLSGAILINRWYFFQNLGSTMGDWEYVGAFIAGMMFSSTFTIATGILLLLKLAAGLDPALLIIEAALGALTADLLVFGTVRNKVANEVAPLYAKIGGSHLRKIMHSRYFGWTIPVMGALIMASPLPDELGVSLMGVSKMRLEEFGAISFLSHLTGIGLIVGLKFI